MLREQFEVANRLTRVGMGRTPSAIMVARLRGGVSSEGVMKCRYELGTTLKAVVVRP